MEESQLSYKAQPIARRPERWMLAVQESQEQLLKAIHAESSKDREYQGPGNL